MGCGLGEGGEAALDRFAGTSRPSPRRGGGSRRRPAGVARAALGGAGGRAGWDSLRVDRRAADTAFIEKELQSGFYSSGRQPETTAVIYSVYMPGTVLGLGIRDRELS